jgi:hypothetical protein
VAHGKHSRPLALRTEPVQKVSRKQKPASPPAEPPLHLYTPQVFQNGETAPESNEPEQINRPLLLSPSEARGEKCRAYISPNGATSKMRSIAAAFHALLCEGKPKPLRSREQRILLHTQTQEPWAQTGTDRHSRSYLRTPRSYAQTLLRSFRRAETKTGRGVEGRVVWYGGAGTSVQAYYSTNTTM